MIEREPPAACRAASWLDGPCAWLAWVLPLILGVRSTGSGARWQDDLGILRGLGLVPAGSEGVLSSLLAPAFALLPVGSRSLRAGLVGVVALAAASAVSFWLLRALLAARRPFAANPLLALLGSQLWALCPELLSDAAGPGSGAVGWLLLLMGVKLIQSGADTADARMFPVAGGLLGLTFGESHTAALWLLLVLLADWLLAETPAEIPWLRFTFCFLLGAGTCLLVPWLRSVSAQAWLDLGLSSLPAEPGLTSAAPSGWSDGARQLATVLLGRMGGAVALLALAGALVGVAARGGRRQLLPWTLLLAAGLLASFTGVEDTARLAALAASAALAVFATVGLQAALAWLWSCRLPFAQPATVLGVSFAVTLVLQRVESAVPGAARALVERGAEAWTEEALGRLPDRSVLLVESPSLALRLLSAQLQGARPDVRLLPLPLLHRGSVRTRLLQQDAALLPVLRQLAVNGVADEYSFSRLADARPLFVQLDARWDPRLLDHLGLDALWLQFAARPLGQRERRPGIARAQAALGRLLAQLERPGGLDARTRELLAEQAGQQALVLAALGETQPAQQVLGTWRLLRPRDAVAQQLAQRLEHGAGRVALNELLAADGRSGWR